MNGSGILFLCVIHVNNLSNLWSAIQWFSHWKPLIDLDSPLLRVSRMSRPCAVYLSIKAPMHTPNAFFQNNSRQVPNFNLKFCMLLPPFYRLGKEKTMLTFSPLHSTRVWQDQHFLLETRLYPKTHPHWYKYYESRQSAKSTS